MTYATEVVQRYRTALRDVWNNQFWSNPSLRDWESVRGWNRLKVPLFEALVAKRLNPESDALTEIFGKEYQVVPLVMEGSSGIPEIIVDVGFQNQAGSCWTPIQGPFYKQDLKLTLLNFFDYDEANWRDLRYYRVRIEEFLAMPDKVGMQALVDVFYADILWSTDQILGLPIKLRLTDDTNA